MSRAKGHDKGKRQAAHQRAAQKMTKPKASTLASLTGFVPWHSQLTHTIPAPKQNPNASKQQASYISPSKWTRGDSNPRGLTQTSTPPKVNKHY